ncbi:MAG: hypothetical protein JW757_11555 [Anaerolineales bacterium]|nr:hypothetical protein [Anaerolineales bacterium]
MNIHFATLAASRFWISEAVLLAKTLRTFGGDFAKNPITILAPQEQPFAPHTQADFDQLSIQSVGFYLPDAATRFPLGIIPYAAAAAESLHTKQCDVLIWLLPDTLILNPPADFILPADKVLAYRPVHHQNIGSSFNQPIDEFWQKIYSHTQTPEDRLFKMVSCYREEVRPYFNAGILAVRPEFGTLQKWAEVFERSYKHPDFTPFYQNQRYAIFMHQAVLAGVILHQLSPGQTISLPESYNYPLHMHADYPPEGKVSQLFNLVTARYESSRELPDFLSHFDDRDNLLNLLS